MTSEEKTKVVREIHNDAVRMLELLNVLIPRIATYNPKCPPDLIKEITDLCWDLGGGLSTHKEELEEVDTGMSDEEYFSRFGC